MSELVALKDIIFESSGGRVSSANNWGKSKKVSGRRAISEARQYSQLHYGEDNIRESTILDVIYGMKQFTLDIVNYRLEDIKESFEKEKQELNQEIERLNNSLAGDFNADDEFNDEIEESLPKSLSTMTLQHHTGSTNNNNNSNSSNYSNNSNSSPVPSDRMEVCTVCNIKRPVSSMMPSTGSKFSSQGSGVICTMCHTTRAMREAKISGGGSRSSHTTDTTTNVGRHAITTGSSSLAHSRSVPAHLHIPTTTTTSSSKLQVDMKEIALPRRNNNEDSPEPAPKSARSSRFRNRLDSARHEHHFLEEF